MECTSTNLDKYWSLYNYTILAGKNFADIIGCKKQAAPLLNREDVRDSGSLWRFAQRELFPGFVEYSGVKELQTIQLELDGASGMVFQQIMKILKQLFRGEIVYSGINEIGDVLDRS